jgi:hypothetical protein
VRLLDGHLDLPLGLATLHLNETIHDGGRIIQRAVWVQGPQGDVIIGEATTGATGAVCGSATITIVSRTTGFSGETFPFTGDLGTFVLPEQGNPTPSDQHVFTVVPGRYSVTQSFVSPLQGLTCSQNAAATIDFSSRSVTVVVKAGDSVTCTFVNGTVGVGAGAPPAQTVHVIPSFNPIVLNPTPRIETAPSSQPTPVPTVTTPSSQPTPVPTVTTPSTHPSATPAITPGTDGGASPSPSARFGKALPATSGVSSAGGFSLVWLLLLLGILALFFFLLFFFWRRKKEQEQEPSP